ncbi:MAG TPA: methyltransferase domain-containing protein [Polyangiaceae bacterium]
MADWDAKAYERISGPQFRWGLRVLERLPLRGDETVVDQGCGAGRLTEVLLDRLPRGRVVAIDASEAMLETARARLVRFGERVSFVRADAATWVAPAPVDAVFSTATYHWVKDHEALFVSVARSLRPGGLLVAQCGAAGNLSRIRSRAASLRARPEYARFFSGFAEPWVYATVDETRARLARAGFSSADVSTEPAPTAFDSAAAFGEFVAKVVLRDDLSRLPDDATRSRYLATVVESAEHDDPPLTLDYVRLNVDAKR